MLFVPWGTSRGSVEFRQSPGGYYGPSSFVVLNDTIILLNSEQNSLMIYKGKTYQETISFALPFTDDVAWISSDLYYLLSGNGIYEIAENSVQMKFKPDSPKQIISTLSVIVDEVLAIIGGQKSVPISIEYLQKQSITSGIQNQIGQIIKVDKLSFQSADVYRDENVLFSISSPDKNLGVVRYIGGSPEGDIYIYMETIQNHLPLKVERDIVIYSSHGNLKTTIKLPLYSHSYIFREFYIDSDGNIYHMISGADGIHIIAWLRNTKNIKANTQYFYPAKYDAVYHYNHLSNQFLERTNLQKSKIVDNSVAASITRSEALTIGDTYVQHQWIAEAKNITNGRIKDPNGIDIQTPSWISVGSNIKVPYKWGGFWTLAGFDQGLLDGKYAGDVATTGVSSYCVGVDCSGFVSRCWNLSSHYSTRMMDDNITIAYDSWDQLQPADAIHKEGHVRMFVDYNNDGSLLTVEAAGRDWRVSYRSFTYADLTAYTPRYYINMQGSPTTIPRPVLSYITINDSIEVAWQISDHDAVGGFIIYNSSDGNSWEYATEDISLSQGIRDIKLPIDSDIPNYYKLTAISTDNPLLESYSSDTYGYRYKSASAPNLLIVDGFDRMDGSYHSPYHNFAMQMGKALSQFNITFETVDNDAVIAGQLYLNGYDAVFWMLGDESVTNESLNADEQEIIKNYLTQGGKIFISGSEIAWDLDEKGTPEDKAFFHDYLCAEYDRDDSQKYTVTGAPGTAFTGLSLHFDDGTHGVYMEDYPDAYKTYNGSEAVLLYENGLIAATAVTTVFPGGSSSGSVVAMGFPFETIYLDNERINLTDRILQYFGLIESGVKDKVSATPDKFILYGNYPNPFNPLTTFRFNIPKNDKVSLVIYDLLGRKVTSVFDGEMQAGIKTISYNATSLASGTYIYVVRWKDQYISGKMKLIK